VLLNYADTIFGGPPACAVGDHGASAAVDIQLTWLVCAGFRPTIPQLLPITSPARTRSKFSDNPRRIAAPTSGHNVGSIRLAPSVDSPILKRIVRTPRLASRQQKLMADASVDRVGLGSECWSKMPQHSAEIPSVYRSSLSRPVEAGTAGLTGTKRPESTQARWLGANRGAR
jgi:hypothetical protein